MTSFCFTIAVGVCLMPALHAASPDVRPQHVTAVVRADAHTGKLVRSVVVTPKAIPQRLIAPVPVASPRSAEPDKTEVASIETGSAFDDLVNTVAKENDLPPQLVHSVIRVESNYNPFAISSKGALGMMQLIPSTARRFGVTNAFNPKQNVEGGAKYLKYLLTLYNGNYPLALAAYNAGEAAVARYGGIPPYAETQNYVHLVHDHWQKLNSRKAPEPPAPAPKPVKPQGAPNSIEEIVNPDGSVRYVTK